MIFQKCKDRNTNNKSKKYNNTKDFVKQRYNTYRNLFMFAAICILQCFHCTIKLHAIQISFYSPYRYL